MGSDTDSDRSYLDSEERAIFEASLKKRRIIHRRALSPRVVMKPIDVSPGTLAAYKGKPPSALAETEEDQPSGLPAPADPMVVVISSPEPSLMMEGEKPEASAARKRTAPVTPPIPSPRRVASPETTAAAVRPGALNVTSEGASQQLEKLLAKLDQLTERLEASERENQALRRELELYRMGTRTVLELHSSAVGTGLGNQAVSQPGPSKRTARRSEQRARAEARKTSAHGPAHQRLLELQDTMRAEIMEEGQRQQRFGGQESRSQQDQLQSADRKKQPRASYRDALTTGWQVVGERRNRGAPKPPPQQQQRPQPPRAPQRAAQPTPRATRRRPDAILVIPAEGVSFADMYRPIRTAPALEDVQKFIRIGKRTPKGNLRMELTREVDSKALCERIQGVLGALGTAKVLTEMAEVIVRNVDHLTQEETLKEALRGALAKEPTVASIRMWELPDATKRARIRLARAEAEAIMGRTQALLIDHSACRMERVPRLAASQRRCFRCLERGHLAAFCTGVDRSQCCIRCGESGHRAAQCKKEVRCMRCGGPHRIAALSCRGGGRTGV
ncbi:uncharacterized protein LOC126566577 [Anopheles maculipalpis]|uniref:uncharacterized protein LOC126566577 n=1 Tax=Anopheles maculipalpis TaxID=1496333 RepID=UPI002159064C|nr:uncharacterized protein LOC126566577 [Anopheles maculipalpis]